MGCGGLDWTGLDRYRMDHYFTAFSDGVDESSANGDQEEILGETPMIVQ